jgi:hypothetical protein
MGVINITGAKLYSVYNPDITHDNVERFSLNGVSRLRRPRGGACVPRRQAKNSI